MFFEKTLYFKNHLKQFVAMNNKWFANNYEK